MGLDELALVALRRPLPAYELIPGDVGTIVFVHELGRAYEVEFLAGDGRTIAVETLDPEDLDPVSTRQVLHIRELGVA